MSFREFINNAPYREHIIRSYSARYRNINSLHKTITNRVLVSLSWPVPCINVITLYTSTDLVKLSMSYLQWLYQSCLSHYPSTMLLRSCWHITRIYPTCLVHIIRIIKRYTVDINVLWVLTFIDGRPLHIQVNAISECKSVITFPSLLGFCSVSLSWYDYKSPYLASTE